MPTAYAILGRIGSLTARQSWSFQNISWTMAGVMVLGVALHAVPPKWFDKAVEVFGRTPFVLQGAALALVVLVIEAALRPRRNHLRLQQL